MTHTEFPHQLPLSELSLSIVEKNCDDISEKLLLELQKQDPTNEERQLFLKVAISAQIPLLERARHLPEETIDRPILYRVDRRCLHTEFSPNPESDCHPCKNTLRDHQGSCLKDVLIKLAVAESVCVHKFPDPRTSCVRDGTMEARFRIWDKLGSMVPCNTGPIIDALVETIQNPSIKHLSHSQKVLLCSLLAQYRFLYSTMTTAETYRKTLFKEGVFDSLHSFRAIGLIATILQATMDARDSMQKSLENLSDGASTIIPCFIQKHAVVIEFRKIGPTYEALVYNTGKRSALHRMAQPEGRKHTYIFPVRYSGLQKEQFAALSNQLVALITRILDPPAQNLAHKEPLTDHIQELYGILQKFGNEVKNPSDDPKLLAYKIQSFKSCQTSCVQAWLRQYFRRQEHGIESYREFKSCFLDFILSSLRDGPEMAEKRSIFAPDEQKILFPIMDEVQRKRHVKRDSLDTPSGREPLWPKYTPL